MSRSQQIYDILKICVHLLGNALQWDSENTAYTTLIEIL